MRRDFGGTVFSSFRKVYNGIVGGTGTVIAVLLYIFAFPDKAGLRVAVGTAALVVTVLLVLILTFADAAYELYKQGPNVSPKLRAVMEPLCAALTLGWCDPLVFRCHHTMNTLKRALSAE